MVATESTTSRKDTPRTAQGNGQNSDQEHRPRLQKDTGEGGKASKPISSAARPSAISSRSSTTTSRSSDSPGRTSHRHSCRCRSKYPPHARSPEETRTKRQLLNGSTEYLRGNMSSNSRRYPDIKTTVARAYSERPYQRSSMNDHKTFRLPSILSSAFTHLFAPHRIRRKIPYISQTHDRSQDSCAQHHEYDRHRRLPASAPRAWSQPTDSDARLQSKLHSSRLVEPRHLQRQARDHRDNYSYYRGRAPAKRRVICRFRVPVIRTQRSTMVPWRVWTAQPARHGTFFD